MAPSSAPWTDSRKLDLLRTHILVTGRQKFDKNAIHQHWIGDDPAPTPRAIADTFNAMMRAISDQATLKSFKKESKQEGFNASIKSEALATVVTNHTPVKRAPIKPTTPKSLSSRKRRRTRDMLSDEDNVMDDLDPSDESENDVPQTPAPKRIFRQQRKAASKTTLPPETSDTEEDKLRRPFCGDGDDESDTEYAPPTP
ncbi:hypothetical protein PV10_03960 [Exophiala mesophila]|uniref:Uncharacterized protein n=1 Tax=Exophiala mesophila TaxID=212818 RepID=A0A0D2A0T4_EXOME|nr:uncharacterized protein PV10_03960 [Exophiala mesophila]KIV92688.1 hypothetical protein PV10_03960 [Exophiala mesophila]